MFKRLLSTILPITNQEGEPSVKEQLDKKLEAQELNRKSVVDKIGFKQIINNDDKFGMNKYKSNNNSSSNTNKVKPNQQKKQIRDFLDDLSMEQEKTMSTKNIINPNEPIIDQNLSWTESSSDDAFDLKKKPVTKQLSDYRPKEEQKTTIKSLKPNIFKQPLNQTKTQNVPNINEVLSPKVKLTGELLKQQRKFPKKQSRFKNYNVKLLDEHHVYTTDLTPLSEYEWRNILELKKDIGSLQRERIICSIANGIPENLRSDIWCHLCQWESEYNNHDPGLFQKLVDIKDDDQTVQIVKDLHRTMSDLKMFGINYKTGENKLYNVLKAYSSYDTQVGYVQGMNYLAAILLIYIKDEVKTFWCFVQLLNRKNWRMIYNRDTPKLVNLLNLVKERLEKDDPVLLNHLEREDVSMVTAFAPIFIAVYVQQVPLDIATRIFEYFIVDGELAIIKLLFTMLEHKRQKLLSLKESYLISYLRTAIIMECIEELTIEQLIFN